jgi:hypothetical protein
MYFTKCNTIDEAKNEFRKLCLILHPDKGGDASEFIKMYNEFKAFRPSQRKENETEFNVDAFYDLVQKFENFEGLIINFVGSFIWLEGETMKHKDALKQIKLDGFKPLFWAKLKKAWFYSPLEYKKKSGKLVDLSEIKSRYGCTTFNAKQTFKIN